VNSRQATSTTLSAAGGGGALSLKAHSHPLFLDGVYELLPRGEEIRFVRLRSPDAQEVAGVLADATSRVVRALAAAGHELDPDLGHEDALARDHENRPVRSDTPKRHTPRSASRRSRRSGGSRIADGICISPVRVEETGRSMIVFYLVPAMVLLFLTVANPHPMEHQAALALGVFAASIFVLVAAGRAMAGMRKAPRRAAMLVLDLALLVALVALPIALSLGVMVYGESRTELSDFEDHVFLIDGKPAGIEFTFRFVPRGFLWVRQTRFPIGRLLFQVDYPPDSVRSFYGGEFYDLDLRAVDVEPAVETYRAGTTYSVRAVALPNFLAREDDGYCRPYADTRYEKRLEAELENIAREVGPARIRVLFENVHWSVPGEVTDCVEGDSFRGCPLILRTQQAYDLWAFYETALALSHGKACRPIQGGRGVSSPF